GGLGVPGVYRVRPGPARPGGGHRHPAEGGPGVRGTAAAVGGGADVRVADPVAAAEPELRAHAGEQPGGGPDRHDRHHGPPARTNASIDVFPTGSKSAVQSLFSDAHKVCYWSLDTIWTLQESVGNPVTQHAITQ